MPLKDGGHWKHELIGNTSYYINKMNEMAPKANKNEVKVIPGIYVYLLNNSGIHEFSLMLICGINLILNELGNDASPANYCTSNRSTWQVLWLIYNCCPFSLLFFFLTKHIKFIKRKELKI